VKDVSPVDDFDALVGALADRLHKDLTRVADGAPLPAIGVAGTCAACEMRGLCRRDYWSTEVLVGDAFAADAGGLE
jgi:ATP-dependent helicase/nuclease subunit B